MGRGLCGLGGFVLIEVFYEFSEKGLYLFLLFLGVVEELVGGLFSFLFVYLIYFSVL